MGTNGQGNRANKAGLYRTAILAVSAILLTAVVVVKMLLSGPPDLVADASKILDCARQGDAACIADHMSDVEVKKGGWTERNVKFAYQEIIVPFWNRQTLTGGVQRQRLTWQGLASQRYKLENGMVFERIMSTVSDGRSSRTVFCDDLKSTFTAMHLIRIKDSPSQTSNLDGLIEGIRIYGAGLRARNVRGFVSADPITGKYNYKDFNDEVIAARQLRQKVLQNSDQFRRAGSRASSN